MQPWTDAQRAAASARRFSRYRDLALADPNASEWKLARYRLGLTQAELARKANVCVSTTKRLENAERGGVHENSRKAIEEILYA